MFTLIDIDPDVKIEYEHKGHKYWYYIFKQLPIITTKYSKIDNAI